MYEIGFLSKTEKAQQFRAWAREIIKKYRAGELQPANPEMLSQIKYLANEIQSLKDEQKHTATQLLNSMLYVKNLITAQNTPEPVNGTWKHEAIAKVKELITEQPFNYSDVKSVLKLIYAKMNTVYGIVMQQEIKDYNAQYNLVGKQSGLEVVSNKESLRSLFISILSDMFLPETVTENPKCQSQPDIIKQTIKPLIEKYNDQSIGGNTTYRKVYKDMGVCWQVRQSRYRNEHGLKKNPAKLKLISYNHKLFDLFCKTVNTKLQEI